MKTQSVRGVVWCGLFSFAGLCSAATNYVWPAASPEVLREELFGLRVLLALEDKGPKGTTKFLRESLAKDPSPHVQAWVARLSLLAKDYGVEPAVDLATAETLANGAAAYGSLVALDTLARVKLNGLSGYAGDFESGVELLGKAATAGYPAAIATEGVLFMRGKGRPKDVARGALMIRRAAALGQPQGLFEIGVDFEMGGTFGPPNLEVAMEHYCLLAQYSNQGLNRLKMLADAGHARARFFYLLARVRRFNEGEEIAPSAARAAVADLAALETGDPRAWVELGVAHLVGVYATRDYARAKNFFERALPFEEDAKMFLAYMQVGGLGVPKEAEAGLAKFGELADKGNARAAAWLGALYYWGNSDMKHVRKNKTKAFHYTRQAAEAGCSIGLRNLAFCYEHGIGTPENYTLAAIIYWRVKQAGWRDGKEKVIRHLAFAKMP
ncbi:MAG: tetratricopeptide repeat protein [Candidatus Didemnitutus sp.]|nr:tetratricopeptide repeat protein [Candidatus Didemnitutus sp.]